MQVQSITNNHKQNSKPAFGHIYEFRGIMDNGKELYRFLEAKGAKPTRDFIGGELGFSDTFHLATGQDSFTPPRSMSITNGLAILGEKVRNAGSKVIEIVFDQRKIEEQLNIVVSKPNKKSGRQAIKITKK